MLRRLLTKRQARSILGQEDNGLDTEYLNLAYQDLTDMPAEYVQQYGPNVTTIDLSYNSFTDLQSLYGFQKLHTLILDHNKIASNAGLVSLPNLKMLSLNDNCINNLSVFIERVAKTYPALRYLSLMKNEAAPSYFNGGTVQQYQDYRNFVISHFSTLQTLDDTRVDEEERRRAFRIYGRRWKRRKNKQPTIKSL